MSVPVTTGSTVSRRVEVAGFQVARMRFPPRLRLGVHEHERPTVAVVLTGFFDGLIRSTARPCPAGTVRIEPAGEPHGNLFGSTGAQVLVVQPDPARDELLEPLGGLLEKTHHLRDVAVTSLARKAVVELAAADTAAPLALEGLVLELLAAATRAGAPNAPTERRPPGWLAQTRALLNDRWSEQLRVADIAATVGVHPVHLTRTFRVHYGLPVGEYLRVLRLDWAATRLAATDDPIADIASHAGFYDQSHFTRNFKHRFGLTPTAYRQVARN